MMDASPATSRRAVLILLAFLVALAIPPQLRLVQHLSPDRYSDLYSPWFGSRAALHHADPYSPAITAQIQRTLYGHVLAPGDQHDPEAFVYPPWIALPLAPLTLLSWPAVELLFAVLTPFVILATANVWMRLCNPVPERGFDHITSLAIYVLILASWPAVWGCYQRQPSLFVAAAIAFSVLLFRRGSDIPAGILLALATVKPQLVLLLGAWLLLVALRYRRWRFIAAFFASFAILIATSAVLFPGSLPHWVHAAIAYTHAAGKVSLLTHLLGPRIDLLAGLALLAAVVLRLWKLRAASPDSPAFVDAVALLLAVTICLIPTNAWLLFNNLLLLPGVLLLFHRPAGPRIFHLLRNLAVIALLLTLLVTPVCAAIGLFTGYRFGLVMPPFLAGYLLPVPLMAALLFAPIDPKLPV
jgi:Glycosyltransferase family 87